MLSVTLDNIKHLPKTDTFGKCDSYVLLELGTHSQKSKVRTRVPCEHCTLHTGDGADSRQLGAAHLSD